MVKVTERYIAAHRNSINSDNIASTIAVMIVPFMQNILTRYSEADFHRVMNQSYRDEFGNTVPGFDFLGDWARNHTTAYPIMIYFARQFRRSLNFNIDIATNLVCDIIAAWHWRVQPRERAAIAHMLFRIKKTIFAL